MKKALSLILVMILLFSALPMTVYAVDTVDIVKVGGNPTSGITGDCEWSYNSETKTLTITGNGYMGDYDSYLDSPWHDYCANIEKVIIHYGVKGVGKDAFGFTNIQFLTLPDSVEYINDYAFYGCSNLLDITFGDGTERIGNYAFDCCWSLTNIFFPDSVRIIGDYAFSRCYFDTINLNYGLEKIGKSAFWADRLTNITIPQTVNNIGEYAFGYNSKYEKVSDFTICGYSNTASETYANENGFTFVDITQKQTINFVSASGVTEPKAGASPIYSATVSDCNGYRVWKNSNVIFKDGVSWYNMTDSTFIFPDNSEKFEAGKEYGVFISLTTTSNDYQFSDEPIVYVNGKKGTVSSKGETTITVFCTFNCPDPIIKKVSVSGITEPVAGKSPIYYAETPSEMGYRVRNYSDTISKNGIGWYNISDSSFVFTDSDEKFAAGKQYGVFITLVTTSNDFQFADELSATVNGKPATISAKGKSSITVFYIFNGSYILGDADGNGEIESVDATFVQRYVANIPTPYITQVLMQGDVDGDGNLTVMDATAIQYYLAQLKTEYPIGQTIS